MSKGFLSDKNGNIKASWVWADDSIPCPHPHASIVDASDEIYYDVTEDVEVFRNGFLARIGERMVTRDGLSVVSVNSGRLVLDKLVKHK